MPLINLTLQIQCLFFEGEKFVWLYHYLVCLRRLYIFFVFPWPAPPRCVLARVFHAPVSDIIAKLAIAKNSRQNSGSVDRHFQRKPYLFSHFDDKLRIQLQPTRCRNSFFRIYLCLVIDHWNFLSCWEAKLLFPFLYPVLTLFNYLI